MNTGKVGSGSLGKLGIGRNLLKTMKEEQAREKYCFQSMSLPSPFKCEASDCMAWESLDAETGYCKHRDIDEGIEY